MLLTQSQIKIVLILVSTLLLNKINIAQELPKEIELLPGFKDKLVFVKGGSYKMGSNASDAKFYDKPVHEVIVSDFYLGKYEVTIGLYKQFCKETSNPFPDFLEGKDANLPATKVSWKEANSFCKWLSKKIGLEIRLPFEAEWEYAARNRGQEIMYATPVGEFNQRGDEDGIDFIAPLPVGSFKANPLGIYDLTGNVSEWCADYFEEDYYLRSPLRNPTGALNAEKRTIRGGSYSDKEYDLRTTSRLIAYSKRKGYKDVGFRVCYSPEGERSLPVEVVLQTGHPAGVENAFYNKKGDLLATCGKDDLVKLWDVKNGRELRTFKGHNSSVISIAFSDDGKYMATAGYDYVIFIWEIETGRLVSALGEQSHADERESKNDFVGHTGPIRKLAFTSDGKYLISGSEHQKSFARNLPYGYSENTLIIWDLSSETMLKKIDSYHAQDGVKKMSKSMIVVRWK